uniref:Uncharacterized protein n=1 Tax=Clastoptera arizonana TaxID=38151 RepID=A0A1B6D540_9HEMI
MTLQIIWVYFLIFAILPLRGQTDSQYLTSSQDYEIISKEEEDDCLVCSLYTLYQYTIEYIGDMILVYIKPIYVVFLSVDDFKNNTSITETNDNGSNGINIEDIKLQVNNEAISEHQSLLDTHPELSTNLQNNEVKITVAEFVEEDTQEDAISNSTPSTTVTILENTMATSSPQQDFEEEKGFFAQVYDVFSNLLG